MVPRHTFYDSAPRHKAYHGGPPLRPPGLAHQPRARFCRARVKGSTDKYTKPRGISQAAHGKHAHLAHTPRLLLGLLTTPSTRKPRQRTTNRADTGVKTEMRLILASRAKQLVFVRRRLQQMQFYSWRCRTCNGIVYVGVNVSRACSNADGQMCWSPLRVGRAAAPCHLPRHLPSRDTLRVGTGHDLSNLLSDCSLALAVHLL